MLYEITCMLSRMSSAHQPCAAPCITTCARAIVVAWFTSPSPVLSFEKNQSFATTLLEKKSSLPGNRNNNSITMYLTHKRSTTQQQCNSTRILHSYCCRALLNTAAVHASKYTRKALSIVYSKYGSVFGAGNLTIEFVNPPTAARKHMTTE